MSDPFGVYSSQLANADANESLIKRLLAEKINRLNLQRGKSLQAGQQNSSDRGLLHSSIALQDQADINQGVDQQVGDAQNQSLIDLQNVQKQRTDAEAAWQAYQQQQTAKTAAATPTFDPTDPYNWKGIAATLPPSSTPDPEDPLGWKAIDAAIKSGQISDPRIKPTAVSNKKRMEVKPPVIKQTAKPTNNIPKQGYY